MTLVLGLWLGLWFVAQSYLGIRLVELGGGVPNQPLSFLALAYLGFGVPILAMRAEARAREGRRMAPTLVLWFGLWFMAQSDVGTRLEDLGGGFPDQPLPFLALIYLEHSRIGWNR